MFGDTGGYLDFRYRSSVELYNFLGDSNPWGITNICMSIDLFDMVYYGTYGYIRYI